AATAVDSKAGRRASRAAPETGCSRGPLVGKLAEERVRLQLAAGRRRRPVPGVDDRRRREALEQGTHRVEQRVPVSARQVDTADRPGEEQVAGEELAIVVVGDVPARVTGDVDHLERDARDGEL